MQIQCQIKAQTLFGSLFIIKEMTLCTLKNKPRLIPLTLDTPSFDFPKAWKKWVLSPPGALNSVMRDSDGVNK